jgi:DNA-binding transcriptional LysR family regulator
MELYQLRSFVAIAEAGQLTRAAEKLHVSQPALSAQLKALEDELDLTLFERTPNGMVPTAAAKRLLIEVEKVLAAAQTLQQEAKALKGEVVGKARIGTLSDPEFARVGEFMSAAVSRYPLLEIELHQGVTGSLLEQVRAGTLDAAFYYGDLKFPAISGLPLREVAYRVTAPAEWRERLRGADWTDVASLPWIIPPPISSHHRLAHTLLSRYRVEPARIVEADQEAVVASLVSSGVGMAIMREDAALEREAAGEVCIWGDASVSTTLWFVYARERERDPVIRALIDVEKDTWGLRRETGAARRRSTTDTAAA